MENEEFDEMKVSFLKSYTIGALASLKRFFDDQNKMSQTSKANSQTNFFNAKDKNGKK
jgi:hypothetical protein